MSTNAMDDDIAEDDGETAAARLESALERIAALARQPRPQDLPAGVAHSAAVDADAIARRLDALIAQLRGALES